MAVTSALLLSKLGCETTTLCNPGFKFLNKYEPSMLVVSDREPTLTIALSRGSPLGSLITP